MQVTVKNVEGGKATIEVVAEYSQYETLYKKAFNELAAKVSVPGFRKGHAPKDIVFARCNPSALEKAANAIIDETINKALAESKLDILPPDVDAISVSNFAPNKDENQVVYTVVAPVYPSVEKKDLKGVNLELVKCVVSDADVDSMLENLRKQHAKAQVTEGAEIAKGTVANIDFLGKKDGVPFEGGAATGYDLNIDTASMIPGFIDQLMGHKAGEEFTIECTFPENYHAEELKGAKATFDIKVNSVAVMTLPEVNEDFLKLFGFETKGVEAFKKSLRANLEQQASFNNDTFNLSLIGDALLEQYPDLTAPESLVLARAKSLVARQFGGKIDKKLLEIFVDSAKFQVEDQVNAQCAIRAAVAAFDLKVDISKEEFDAEVDKTAVSYEDAEEFKKAILADDDLRSHVYATAANHKVCTLLADLFNSSIVEKSFEEFQKLSQERDAKKEEQAGAKMKAYGEKMAAEKAE